jgi:hypothetical protein
MFTGDEKRRLVWQGCCPLVARIKLACERSHGERKCAVVTIGMFGDIAMSRLFDPARSE